MRSAAIAAAAACSPMSWSGRSPSSCCASRRRTCSGSGWALRCRSAITCVFMPIGLLMLLLPISVSGFGLPQGVIVWLLRPVGVADEQSFALSTLIVLTGLAGNLPGPVVVVAAEAAKSCRILGLHGTSLCGEVPGQGCAERASRPHACGRREVHPPAPHGPHLPLHLRLRRPLRDVQQLDPRRPQDRHDPGRRSSRPSAPTSGRTSRTRRCPAASRPRATTWSTSAG